MKRVSGAWMATNKLGLYMRLRRETAKCASDQAKHSYELCRHTYSTSKSKERVRLEMSYNW